MRPTGTRLPQTTKTQDGRNGSDQPVELRLSPRSSHHGEPCEPRPRGRLRTEAVAREMREGGSEKALGSAPRGDRSLLQARKLSHLASPDLAPAHCCLGSPAGRSGSERLSSPPATKQQRWGCQPSPRGGLGFARLRPLVRWFRVDVRNVGAYAYRTTANRAVLLLSSLAITWWWSSLTKHAPRQPAAAWRRGVTLSA